MATPEPTAEVVQRIKCALIDSNVRFVGVLIGIFLLGHLHELSNEGDSMTFWILSALWLLIALGSSSILSWVLNPLSKIKQTKET